MEHLLLAKTSRVGLQFSVDCSADRTIVKHQCIMASSIEHEDGPPSKCHVPFLKLHSIVAHEDKEKLIPSRDFANAYGPFQALHVRGFVPRQTSITSSSKHCPEVFRPSDVHSLFQSLNDLDKKSWCIENETNENTNTTPGSFLDVNNKNQRGYCSFLVQQSKEVMNELLSKRLPMTHLPVACESEPAEEEEDNNYLMKVHYGPCLWLFFGKNSVKGRRQSSTTTTTTKLQGRPEHTDSVPHDGTWHYQLSGTKIWRLRPTTELIQRIMGEGHKNKTHPNKLSGNKRKMHVDAGSPNDGKGETSGNDDGGDTDNKSYIEVECKQGDILLLNTRLWWHSTLIPPQDEPCISYARDIYFPNSKAVAGNAVDGAVVADAPPDSCNSSHEENVNEKDGRENDPPARQQSSMTNVDGTYAAEDIEAETILFTENTMPDCELHRSKTDPNCQVMELEDEKTGESYMAVVSLRAIKTGEFFCVLESDDEEDDDDCSEGDDDCSEEEVEEWEEDASDAS